MTKVENATTLEQRAGLTLVGFVRVDGLNAYRYGDNGEFFPYYPIEADSHHLGHWGYNNGMAVIVTLGGEVWLATAGGSQERRKMVEALHEELSPYGQGAFVPCSNGEDLLWSDILNRMADPDWDAKE